MKGEAIIGFLLMPILAMVVVLAVAEPYVPASGETIVTINPGGTATLYSVPITWSNGMTALASGGQVDLVERVPIPIPVTINTYVGKNTLTIWVFINEAQTDPVNVRVWWRVE